MSSSTKYLTKLHGTRVLIIGGTSGIGYGLAEALIEHGAASLILSSSNQQRINKSIVGLRSTYPSTTCHIQGITCNLGNSNTISSEVERLFAQVAPGGKLDHIIYTAGDALAMGDIESFTLQSIQQAGMTRFFGPLIVAQHVRKHLKPGPASSYTLTTGGMTTRPRPGWAVIMSYLTGLEGMGQALARDFAPMRVNVIGPGPVDTELWVSHIEREDMEAFKAERANSMATGRFGRVEDVVESYLYVMKDHNDTGSMIYTNGGGLLM